MTCLLLCWAKSQPWGRGLAEKLTEKHSYQNKNRCNWCLGCRVSNFQNQNASSNGKKLSQKTANIAWVFRWKNPVEGIDWYKYGAYPVSTTYLVKLKGLVIIAVCTKVCHSSAQLKCTGPFDLHCTKLLIQLFVKFNTKLFSRLSPSFAHFPGKSQ